MGVGAQWMLLRGAWGALPHAAAVAGGMHWWSGGPRELEGLRVRGWVPTVAPPALLWCHHRPGVLVLEGGWAGRIWGLGLLQSHHFALDLKQLLLDVAEEVLDTGIFRRPDCVTAHAALTINAYPRGDASGSLLGFGLGPSRPPGVKVLHARPAVIAGRAYWLIDHKRGCRCGRRCPGTTLPGWRLCGISGPCGRVTPGRLLMLLLSGSTRCS